jgi:hypothetical protein
MDKWLYPCDFETGINSSIDINTISPSMPERIYPRTIGLIKGKK